MYDLTYFKEEDKVVVFQFMKENPFAFITGCDEHNKPVATQIPLFIDERDDKLFLSGHIMKNTDHHKAFLYNPNVLAVFTGANTYVSAGVYDNPNQASTWNYISVHAKGTLSCLDHDALLHILKRTTDHFDGSDPNSPSSFDNLREAYVQHLSKAIVAFEIEVKEIDNVFKLSQNRDEKSYHNIIEYLHQRKDAQSKVIATEMEKRIEEMNKKWHKQ
jgi:transcriptional regulator